MMVCLLSSLSFFQNLSAEIFFVSSTPKRGNRTKFTAAFFLYQIQVNAF